VFDRFSENFSAVERAQAASRPVSATGTKELDELLTRFAGCSFNSGLYRLHQPSDIPQWNTIVGDAFPRFSGRIMCFGYDWLGRHFALDSQRKEKCGAAVTMFEPGTGEALEIPCNLVDFHNAELIDYHDAALASTFFKKWQAAGNPAPKFEQCVGYKRPLFLGGKDTVENLELSDLDVYWHLMGQLIRQAKGLPAGTAVRVR
jgi:hypothetical protein